MDKNHSLRILEIKLKTTDGEIKRNHFWCYKIYDPHMGKNDVLSNIRVCSKIWVWTTIAYDKTDHYV